MNAAAAERLNGLIGTAASAPVMRVTVTEPYHMTAGLVRKIFTEAAHLEINEHGMGARQPDGSWLWLDQPQSGGPR